MSNYRNKTTGVISTQGEVRRANKHRSFPKVWDDSVHALLDIEPILAAPKPSCTALEQVNSTAPVQDALSNWVEGWEVVAKHTEYTDSDDVIQTKAAQDTAFTEAETARTATSARSTRNTLLGATDWAGNSDVTMSSAMTTYRQALRDVPNQAGFPETITWPEEV
jgi:hypothetical protein